MHDKAAEPSDSGGVFGQPSLKREEKRMRKAVSVTALILALTCPVYAGDMPNGSPQPPPQPATTEQEQNTTTDNSESETPDGAADSLTETVLDLLADVLALI
jgi:hypothetical protein